MKTVILYRPQSEHARAVEEFAHDIERQQNIHPQLLDVDTPGATALVDLYGITSYPAVIVTREDGQLIQLWAGDQLPLMQEVAAFARG